jgi:serine phosphatase RsbU (regulator of sigma subunit)
MRRGGDYGLIKDHHCAPLGVMEDMVYRSYDLHLDPGDCLYVYTDGIPEAINVKEEQYGTDRMLSVLNDNKDATMKDLLRMVKENQDEFVGEADQFDDITMLGFRYKGL